MLSCSRSFKVLVYLRNFLSDFCRKGAKLSEVKMATSLEMKLFFSFCQLFIVFTKANWRWMDGRSIEIICFFVSSRTNGHSLLWEAQNMKMKYNFIFEQKHSLLVHLWILELISIPCLLSDFCKIWWRPNRKVRE